MMDTFFVVVVILCVRVFDEIFDAEVSGRNDFVASVTEMNLHQI